MLIKRVKNGIGAERKKGQGRVAIKMTSANRDKISDFSTIKPEDRREQPPANSISINLTYEGFSRTYRKNKQFQTVLSSRQKMRKPSVVFFEENIKILSGSLTMSPILPSLTLRLPEMMSTTALMF